VKAVIETRNLSKWYGNVLGLSDVSLEIEPGITGLLGPNGAGKSTFMKLLTGQLKPSIGSVAIHGRRIWNDYPSFAGIGFCPEADAFYEEISGREFIAGLLSFNGYSESEIRERTQKALDIVDLASDADRRIRGYSRGMRQRIKFAQTIAHDPEIIVLDEPLSGLDPLGKRKLIHLIKEYRDQGRTILVSSHVLPEIEAMTTRIILIHQGKILAQGDVHYIRDLIDAHPHVISIRSGDPRGLASQFVGEPYVQKIQFGSDGETINLETFKRDSFFNRLNSIILESGIRIDEITSPDDNLQAVFDYLVGK
jgi:ABC-2 type transport system ATP-binding protein